VAKRKGISKRVRFEIFKRDLFTCRYCGKRPPDVLLGVDHVIPIAKGGGDEDDNLVTSCVVCNRGKSDVELGAVVPAIDELTRLAALQEVLERAVGSRQAVEVARIQATVEDDAAGLVAEWWESAFGSIAGFEPASVKRFLGRLGIDDLRHAINVTESRFPDLRAGSEWIAWKYFCGVCWGMIRDRENAHPDEGGRE